MSFADRRISQFRQEDEDEDQFFKITSQVPRVPDRLNDMVLGVLMINGYVRRLNQHLCEQSLSLEMETEP